MRAAVLALFCSALAFGNACSSTGAVSTNSATNWGSCGSTYPHDGDSVTVNSGNTLTLTSDMGSTGNGLGGNLTILSGGTMVTDGGARHNIYFASTGSTPNTNMWGILVGGPTATLDFTAATLANYVTVQPGSLSFATFISSCDFFSGTCGSPGAGGTINLNYTICTNCGSTASATAAVQHDNETTPTADNLQVTNSVFVNPTGGVINTYGWGGNGIFSGNYVTGPGCNNSGTSDASIFSDYAYGGNRTVNWTVSRNTVRNPIASCTQGLFAFFYSPLGVITMDRNGWQDAGTNSGRFLTAGSTTLLVPGTESYTVMYVTTPASASDRIEFAFGGTSPSITYTISKGVYEGTLAIAGSSYNNTTGNHFIATSADAGGQGSIIRLGGSNAVDSGNMTALVSNAGNICELAIDVSGVTMDHAGCVGTLPDSGNSSGLQPGESGHPSTSSIVRNSLINFWVNGINNGDGSSNSFTSDYAGVGVHHNGTCGGNTNAYAPSGAQGVGFDNGSTAHPSATYGDYTGPCHFVKPLRTIAMYDAFIGGPGTVADYYNGLTLFNTPLASVVGMTASVANLSLYDPALLYAFKQRGFATYDVPMQTAGNGTYIGPVQPILIGAFQ